MQKRPECVNFGKGIRALRLKSGLSQEAFADEVGIDRTYMSGIERGVRNPTLTMVCRIAKALRLRPAHLLKNL
jgi:transcriptional regulator with XRE-family HTH domain